jgi:hypothetical protein
LLKPMSIYVRGQRQRLGGREPTPVPYTTRVVVNGRKSTPRTGVGHRRRLEWHSPRHKTSHVHVMTRHTYTSHVHDVTRTRDGTLPYRCRCPRTGRRRTPASVRLRAQVAECVRRKSVRRKSVRRKSAQVSPRGGSAPPFYRAMASVSVHARANYSSARSIRPQTIRDQTVMGRAAPPVPHIAYRLGRDPVPRRQRVAQLPHPPPA